MVYISQKSLLHVQSLRRGFYFTQHPSEGCGIALHTPHRAAFQNPLSMCPFSSAQAANLLLSACLLPGGNLGQTSLCPLYLSPLYCSPESKLNRHPPKAQELEPLTGDLLLLCHPKGQIFMLCKTIHFQAVRKPHIMLLFSGGRKLMLIQGFTFQHLCQIHFTLPVCPEGRQWINTKHIIDYYYADV